MNENIKNIKITYTNEKIEEIDNSENNKDITCDFCSRCVWINQYKKKAHEGQIVSRIILFEQVKELEITK